MNIFEVSDRDGDTLSIDLDQDPNTDNRFMSSMITRDGKFIAVIFGDDAARALVKALSEALQPEDAEQTISLPEGDEPVSAPTYQPNRAAFISLAIQLLRNHNLDFCPGDVVRLAYFLSETDR